MRMLTYAIVFVSDMDRSIASCRDTLGLPLKFASPAWTEIANNGSTIALHHTDTPPSPPAADGRAPAGACQLCFNVEDIDAVHAHLVARGVSCLRPPTLAEEAGLMPAIYADPDRLRLTVTAPVAVTSA